MKLGAHIASCCFIHGCHFNSDCPIVNDDLLQESHCQKCTEMDKANLEKRKQRIHKDTPTEWAAKLNDQELFDHLGGFEWDDKSVAVLNEMMKRFLTKE